MHIGIPPESTIGNPPRGRTIRYGPTHIGVHEWGQCKACRLHRTRRRVVLYRCGGQGPITVMIVGEAPGELEDVLGLPFVGAAGRVLEVILEMCHMNFKYVITNVVCCRPCSVIYLDDSNYEVPFEEMIEGEDYEITDWNREPTDKEIEKCRPHIDQLIEIVKPKGVIALGEVAGRQEYNLPTLKLLHPAYILRKEYKLVTVREQARKIDLFIEKLLDEEKT